ncbi:MAG: lysophospholipid acyltransferase family protein [Blastocatellia bacterium]
MEKQAESNTIRPAVVPRPGVIGHIRYYLALIAVALSLIIMGTPVLPISWILVRLFNYREFIYPFGKIGARLYMAAAGARVHLSGHEHLTQGQPYVFVANHQSNLDPPMLMLHLGGNPGVLAKKELFRIPLLGQGFRLAHILPIDRSNRESAIATTRAAADKIRHGISVFAFPEGTRSLDGSIGQFKKGVFHMAIEAGVPVVPVVVNDTRLVMRKGTKYCIPGDVYMDILPPIPTTGYTEENLDEFIARVRAEFPSRVRTD